MNAVARTADFGPTVAEYGPHRFTADEVVMLVRQGVFGDTRVELLDGRVYDMPADGVLHLTWSRQLNWWINAALGLRYSILSNATLRLNASCVLSPDWYVFGPDLSLVDIGGADVLLLIEQSDSSLRRDLTDKAVDYSRYGVRDYWVIDLQSERIHVHREPTPQGYASVQVFGREDVVEALLIPHLALRISDLPQLKD